MKQILTVILVLCNSVLFAADNVVILFDSSGSMEQSMRRNRIRKIDIAKQALSGVAEKLPPDTNIGLLTFGGWSYELGPVNKDQLLQAIQRLPITPSSGTPLGTYMKKAADALLVQREKLSGYGTYKLFIITDGEANQEPSNLVNVYLTDILSRGLTVECVGVDMADAHALSKRVHKYMRADDPNSFKESVAHILPEVANTQDGLVGFEEVAPLPKELCKTIIETLSVSGNYPIGERPPVKVVDAQGNVTYQAPQPAVATSSSNFWGWFLGIVVGIIVLSGIIGYLCSLDGY